MVMLVLKCQYNNLENRKIHTSQVQRSVHPWSGSRRWCRGVGPASSRSAPSGWTPARNTQSHILIFYVQHRSFGFTLFFRVQDFTIKMLVLISPSLKGIYVVKECFVNKLPKYLLFCWTVEKKMVFFKQFYLQVFKFTFKLSSAISLAFSEFRLSELRRSSSLSCSFSSVFFNISGRGCNS